MLILGKHFKRMSTISNIKKNQMCLGCGLCESIDKQNCKMILNEKGFYEPQFKNENKIPNKEIKACCPAITINADENNNHQSIWGKVVKVANSWAKDATIRKSSSSGGVTSALAIYLLETKKVDAVLHVGVESGTYLYNKLHISRTRKDILKHNASRYAPAAIFNDIIQILESTGDDTFAFIGKPCDIAGLRNLLKLHPHFKSRVKYFLAIFCAGMPTYEASRKAIATFGRKDEPISLQYRGDGWPGYFTAAYKDGSTSKMTYNESWGKILGRELGFRCKICPDGIGMLADIASGDSWNTKNGYPDFTEGDGRNFCFIRTQQGLHIFEEAERLGYIQTESLDVSDVQYMQRYQYDRRHYVGWRIAAVQIVTLGLLNFHGLGYICTAFNANYIRAFRDMAGTFKRILKVRRN